jgi:hypothetical protein
MKSKILSELNLGFLAVMVACICAVYGCTTQNPAYTPVPAGQPDTNTVPRYIPNPTINSVSNAISGVAGAVAPLNPYAGLTSWALTAAFGIFGGISTWVARQKSGALGSLASSVVQAGAHPAVLEAAANTPHFAAIASAINDNVASNQSLTGTPPKV